MEYATNTVPYDTACRYERNVSEYCPSVALTLAASAPISMRSAWRLPATMNNDPNEATMKNHSEIGTPVAAAPATARSTKPAATATMSTTAMCLSTDEYSVVMMM